MSETPMSPGNGNDLDVPTLRKGISNLSVSDKKYIVIATLQELKEEFSSYVRRHNGRRLHEALRDLPRNLRREAVQRSGGVDASLFSQSRDPDAQRQLIITWGVLTLSGLVTIAFMAAVAFQVEGVTQLGTAFTTLLAAVTGFFAGRGEGQSAGPRPSQRSREHDEQEGPEDIQQ